jgi:hypothetical protein
MKFKKIRKTTAKKLYDEGTQIYVVPCKVYPSFSNPWIKPFEMQYTNEMKERDQNYPSLAFENTFESRINAFEFYNCNDNQAGKAAAYYIYE